MNNQFNLYYEAEMNEGVKVTTLSPVFCSGDDQAHRFIVKAMRNGKAMSLSGATVSGFFIRPDNVTITLEGTVNTDGEAVVTLNNACYNKQGRFQFVIRAAFGGVTSTLFCGIGSMIIASTDAFVDTGNVVSLDDLMDQIEAMQEATARANEAADRADIDTIVQMVLDELDASVIGKVDADNSIILTSRDLAPGTYTFKYENEDGTLTVIGTAEVTDSEGGGDEPGDEPGEEPDVTNYTNQIKISTDTDGSIYNGKGWIENKRLNSTGDVTDVGTYGYTGVTGFIPIANGDIIRTSANMVSVNGSEQQAVHFYNANKTFVARRRFIVANGKFENNLYTLNADNSFEYRHNDGWTDIADAAYIRVCMGGITDGAIITKNEVIA